LEYYWVIDRNDAFVVAFGPLARRQKPAIAKNQERSAAMSVSKIRNSERREATNLERLLVGKSQQIWEIEQEIMTSAGGDITVLITGESGVGKELVARAVHLNSKRATGPFITINCGSLTESLLASEFFGHVKGAFTGAAGPQRGLFEAANGGSVFLDEIGDMPLQMQVYLLRVLQERTILPVGSHTEKRVDVRIIAATNKDLHQEAMHGRFRQDLYYRLNGFPIRVPALRERPSDIPILVHHFLGDMKIREEGLALLCGHTWPGNVRELRTTIERLTLRAKEVGLITADQVRRELRLSEEVMAADAAASRDSRERRDTITFADESRGCDSFKERLNLEKLAYYQELVRSCGGRAKAAESVGLTYSALYHRMERLRREVEDH
jgi:transcriptional regulator with PAS, ATPase and Fis domain